MVLSRMIRVRIRLIESCDVVSRHCVFDLVCHFRTLSLMLNNFFLMHRLLMCFLLILEDRLMMLKSLLFLCIEMTFVVSRLKSRLVDYSSMIFWLTINLLRTTFIMVENRHVRAALLMFFLLLLDLRDMSHTTVIFNDMTMFLILRTLLVHTSVMCLIVRFVLNLSLICVFIVVIKSTNHLMFVLWNRLDIILVTISKVLIRLSHMHLMMLGVGILMVGVIVFGVFSVVTFVVMHIMMELIVM